MRPDDPVGVSAAHQAGQNFYHHHQTGQDPPKITQRAKNADADENWNRITWDKCLNKSKSFLGLCLLLLLVSGLPSSGKNKYGINENVWTWSHGNHTLVHISEPKVLSATTRGNLVVWLPPNQESSQSSLRWKPTRLLRCCWRWCWQLPNKKIIIVIVVVVVVEDDKIK